MADAAILIFCKIKSIDPGNQMGHVIALFICFLGWRVHFWSYFKVLRWKSRWKGLILNIVDGLNHTWLLLGTLFRNILDFIMVICFIILIFSIILLFDTVGRHDILLKWFYLILLSTWKTINFLYNHPASLNLRYNWWRVATEQALAFWDFTHMYVLYGRDYLCMALRVIF